MKTFHRDVKPGNILLTLDHGPQLLDFNLAESPHAAQQAESAMLGGTLPTWLQSRLRLFSIPIFGGRSAPGRHLFARTGAEETLTGQAPDLPDEKIPSARAMKRLLDRRMRLVTDLRRFNSQIPHALQAIVVGCLCFNAGRSLSRCTISGSRILSAS